MNPLISILVIHKEKTNDVLLCFDGLRKAIEHSIYRDNCEVLESDEKNFSQNISEERNNLVKKAKGDIIVFIDSDAIPSLHWLDELILPFSNGKIAVVGGCHIIRQDAGYWERLSDKILTFPFATFKSCSRYRVTGILREVDEAELTTCNIAIRREVLERAGGFPVEFVPCEENVLLNRIQFLGYKMIYNPVAIVYHRRDKLFIPYARKMFSYGKGRGRMIKAKMGGLKMIPNLSFEFPVLLALGLMVHYASYISGLIYGYFTKNKESMSSWTGNK